MRSSRPWRRDPEHPSRTPSPDTGRALIVRSRGARLRRRRRAAPGRGRARGAPGRRAARPALRLAGVRARRDAGRERAAADLLVGPPDPRAVARELALPRGAPGLQQDLRRRRSTSARSSPSSSTSGATSSATRSPGSAPCARARSGPRTSASPWAIAIATVPAAIVGALGEDTIDNHLGQPWQIAFFLAFFAILLWVADRRPQRGSLDASRLPTAVADRHLADPRADARRLALGDHDHGRPLRAPRPRRRRALLVPAADPDRARRRPLQGAQARRARPAAAGSTGPFIVGTIASAAVGLVAIDLLLGYVRRHSYLPFVIYRLVIAALIVIAIASAAGAAARSDDRLASRGERGVAEAVS